MSTPETSTETPSRWRVLTKGAIGTVVLAVGGYLGAAMMQVISAPKDSVAYDLIQSMTGMLKPATPASAPEPRPVVVSQPAPASANSVGATPASSTPASVVPAAPEQKLAAIPSTPLSATPPQTSAPQTPAPIPPPAAVTPPTQAAPLTAVEPSPSPQPAPEGTMLDRVRKTADLARQARASTAALGASRVLTLADHATTPICGATYQIEVSSIAPGAGQVTLRRQSGTTEPVALTVGQPPKTLGAGCRIVLLSATEDLTNRRAQLREVVVE